MILAVLALVGLAWWFHRDGLLLPNLRRLGVAAGSGLIALRLAETGQIIGAVAVVAMALTWWRWSAPREPATSEIAAARAALGVAPTAGRDEVHAAWRRAMAAAHPDGGGSVDGAVRVTAARDLLLRCNPSRVG